MLFNSFTFVVFFAITYGLYVVLKPRAQNIMLLAASYVFYGWWDARFLGLILISTLLDYFCSLRIHAEKDQKKRRFFLLFSICSNLGILFFFKYFGFFAESLADALGLFGISPDFRLLHIVLPVGISFYTFQTMSYTIDVYGKKMLPARDFLDFALFVSFFPQLVAGPIERASSLLPQIQNRRTLNYKQIRQGCWLILLGYYKKVVLADNLAIFVNQIYNSPDEAHGLAIPAATLAFAFQIYGDFSGYSDIARGISKLMGIELMQNFRRPYFAVNPSDFWQRWHISLSTWLRDYLYIPLGGNRGSALRTYVNLSITMLLGGLWHGAAWNFVVWGAFHGLILVVYRIFPSLGRAHGRLGHGVLTITYFPLTLFGWMLFRVNELNDLPVLIANTFGPLVLTGKLCLLTLAIYALPVLLLDVAQERADNEFAIQAKPRWVRYTVYMILVASIFLSGAMHSDSFIYFQF